MKKILLLSFLIISLSAFGQKDNPYLLLKFDKVIMYDFEPSGDKGGSIVEANGVLTKHISNRIQLDNLTINKLIIKLGDKNSFNYGTAACFEPHLGFVFFNYNKIVAHITICLSCNRLYSSIELPSQKRSNNTNESKSFRQFLNMQLKKNKFSHQIEQGSSFD